MDRSCEGLDDLGDEDAPCLFSLSFLVSRLSRRNQGIVTVRCKALVRSFGGLVIGGYI